MTGAARQPRRCELCGRTGPALTRHHLIPRTRHGNRWNRRNFDREDVQGRIAWLCRSCHDHHVHNTLSEKELEREFNTLDRLRQVPAIARFVAWIADKPASFRPPTGRRTRRRRGR